MTRKIFKPFGPTILKAKMSEELIKNLNDYTDEKSNLNLKEKKLDAGNALAGNVSQEIYLDEKFMKESGFGTFLFSEVANWIYSTKKKKINKFKIYASWIVIYLGLVTQKYQLIMVKLNKKKSQIKMVIYN